MIAGFAYATVPSESESRTTLRHSTFIAVFLTHHLWLHRTRPVLLGHATLPPPRPSASPRQTEIAHQVARHSAERMSSVKVLFVLGYLLEALGLDVGVSRLLLTFLLQ